MTMRGRLTVAGFVVIYATVLVLFGVMYLSEDETVTTVDGVEVAVRTSHDLGWVELAVLVLAPVAALLAWWWAGRAVRPIERIRTVAERIEATDLSERIDLRTGPAEIVQLAASFDAMLDRLHDAATRQRQVLDEISHELRTPIAVLVTNADVRLARREPTVEWFREGLEQSRRTAERMHETLERLLVDARSQAHTMDRHPADLMEVARGVVADLDLVGMERGVRVTLDGPEQLMGSWDAPLVARALTNLVDNAVRHSPGGTAVRVVVRESGRGVAVSVSDHGPGIPPAQLESVFDRSWRAGPAGEGRGLGLAIARQIAEAHGGELTVRSPDPDGFATTFLILLPRSDIPSN